MALKILVIQNSFALVYLWMIFPLFLSPSPFLKNNITLWISPKIWLPDSVYLVQMDTMAEEDNLQRYGNLNGYR